MRIFGGVPLSPPSFSMARKSVVLVLIVNIIINDG
jgi:hypothetical protein